MSLAMALLDLDVVDEITLRLSAMIYIPRDSATYTSIRDPVLW